MTKLLLSAGHHADHAARCGGHLRCVACHIPPPAQHGGGGGHRLHRQVNMCACVLFVGFGFAPDVFHLELCHYVLLVVAM
jgi:hypothetical protein